MPQKYIKLSLKNIKPYLTKGSRKKQRGGAEAGSDQNKKNQYQEREQSAKTKKSVSKAAKKHQQKQKNQHQEKEDK